MFGMKRKFELMDDPIDNFHLSAALRAEEWINFIVLMNRHSQKLYMYMHVYT